MNNLLAGLRFVLVSVLCMLLLGPLVNMVQHKIEKPIMVFAIDNSRSIPIAVDSAKIFQVMAGLEKSVDQLKSMGWDPRIITLDGWKKNIRQVKFDANRSDITAMLQRAENELEGSNLQSLILVSDGIYNAGFSPEVLSALTPIYSLGIGDTTSRQDISILNIKHNQTVYEGDKFPVQVNVKNQGMASDRFVITLSQGGKIIDQKIRGLKVNDHFFSESFEIEANHAGKNRFDVRVSKLTGEMTDTNNNMSFYLDVVQGHQKVSLIYDAPHPDIKALAAVVNQNDHFELSIGHSVGDTANVDLVIYYQVPSFTSQSMNAWKHRPTTIPSLLVVGSHSNINQLMKDQVLDVILMGKQFDQVTPVVNPSFSAFQLPDEIKEWTTTLPPAMVPFAKYQLSPNDEILLTQRIGSVATDRPLAFFEMNDSRTGVILAEGFWKWRMDEFRRTGDHAFFDELFSKIIQYLAAKPDKKQFKFYPKKETFEVGEPVIFNAEIYNQLFEPTFGQEVQLSIGNGKSPHLNFSYTPVKGNTEYIVNNLEEGVYTYQAQTLISGKFNSSRGEFVVKKPNIEQTDLSADFRLLRQISTTTGGSFYSVASLDSFTGALMRMEPHSIIHSRQRQQMLLSLYWLMIGLFVLSTVEWLLRKIEGGY